jgi:hypothetical protein
MFHVPSREINGTKVPNHIGYIQSAKVPVKTA